jgi:anaerobic magnesium-protoporphyrin IX monomethyl ester cyclase
MMNKYTRILLLNPPDPKLLQDAGAPGYAYFEPPLGLLYVYSHLKGRGAHDVRFLDMNIEMRFKSRLGLKETLNRALSDFRPDLVAIASLYYSSIPVFHAIAAAIKEGFPDVTVAMGGHYPTHMTADCLADPNVDFAILAEGELGLSGLLDALNAGTDLAEVEGLAFKTAGQITRNPRKSFWSGFSSSGRLPWEDIDFRSYFQDSRNVLQRVADRKDLRIAAITATRGCPNNCTFCSSPSFWKRRWRKRPVSEISAEIVFLKTTYGVNTIVFNDENISADPKWFMGLMDELEKLDVVWISNGGLSISSINDEKIIRKMYSSGIGLFNLAVESGSDETLRRVNKRLTLEQTRNVIRLIRENGDGFAIGFFITGFPFEDFAGVRKTIAFAEELDLDWRCFYCFQPFPGCELMEYCQSQGLIDSFDPNYGENAFAPKLKYLDYTAEELNHENYLANLRVNFVGNRNLLLATEASLAQAERDFKYVLDMIPDHVFAFLGLAGVSERRGEALERDRYLLCAKEAAGSSGFDWRKYLDIFAVNIL